MLDLEAKFSPKIIPASVEYPYGKIKPNTTPVDNDGTPVAADIGNDMEGFKQAAIVRANITPSGLPDTATDSQLLDALDKRYLKIDYQTWTFATGGTLTACSQAVKHTDGNYYSWTGTYPKVVAAGTDPTAVGSGYVPRTDVILRSEITPSIFESLRRSYAEAGFTMVDGSFEEGGTLTSTSDVLLHKARGIAYSWDGTLPITVASNSTPTPLGAGGWIDRSDVTLRSVVTAHKAEQDAHEIEDITGLTEALASIGDGSGGGFGGQYKNLAIIVSGTGYEGTITADGIVVESSDYKTSVIHGLNISFNGATVGAGGLDTGSIAANTWYYIYVVYNPISKTPVALLSISATAPILPTGYTHFARVGAAYSESSNFRISTQNDNIVMFSLGGITISPVQVLNNGGSSSPAPFYLDSAVPMIAKSAFININSNGTALLLVSADPAYIFSVASAGLNIANTVDFPLLFGRVAYYRISSGLMTNYVIGYKI